MWLLAFRIRAVLIGARFAASEGHPQSVEWDDHEDAWVAAVVAALGARTNQM